MRIPLVPRGALASVLAVVTITAIVGLTANTLLYEGASRFSVREEEARRTSEHIVVVARMLAKTPVERYPSMNELIVALANTPEAAT